jgi:WD40 repeat protein
VLPENGDLLLVIDQFEEVFSLVKEEEAQARFLELVRTAVEVPDSRVRVILTLRADFYDRPLQHPGFGQLVEQNTVVVLPLTAEELEEAVRRPAERAGAVLEKGLVTEITADVADQPGALPLFQYALTELFEAREGRMLTNAAYREIGGVLGALGRRAEELNDGLDVGGRQAARQLFLRLVTLGDNAEDSRRRVARTELETLSESMKLVIEFYGRARLLSFDHDPETRAPTVEVAHEALLSEWKRLRDWLDESRADLRMGRVLDNAAREWETSGKEASYQLRGARLSQFEAWAQTTDLTFTPLEREYLEASLAERKAREELEAERQARGAMLEARARRFLRILVAVFAGAAVISIGLSIFAFNQQAAAESNADLANRNAATATVAQGQAEIDAAAAIAAQSTAVSESARADEAAAEAQSQEAIAVEQRGIAESEARAALEAYSLSLAANAQTAVNAGDSLTALMLAIQAVGIEDPPEAAVDVLQQAAFMPGLHAIHHMSGEYAAQVIAFHPGGAMAVAGLESGAILEFDPATGEMIRSLQGHNADVTALTFNAAGTLLFSAALDQKLILWDYDSGEILHRLDGPHLPVDNGALALSPDGSLGVSGSYANLDSDAIVETILWDLETGEMRYRLEGIPMDVLGVSFTPDGRFLLVTSGSPYRSHDPENMVLMFDVDTGEIVRNFAGLDADKANFFNNAVSTDGSFALSGSRDGNVYLWDLETGMEIGVLEGDNWPLTVRLTQHNERALVVYESGNIVVWDLTTLEPLVTLNYPDVWYRDVAISPDGRWVLSNVNNGDILVWDLAEAGEIQSFRGHTARVTGVDISPDGKYLLSGSGDFDKDDNSVRLWDLETGQEISVLEGHTSTVSYVAFLPDGQHALSSAYDNTLRLWDLETGQTIQVLEGHIFWPVGFDIRSDGKEAISAGFDGQVIRWDLETGELVQRLIGHFSLAWDVAYLPGEEQVISAGDEGLILWDLASGEQIRSIPSPGGQILSVDVTPDGRRAVGGIWVWDIYSGELVVELDYPPGSSPWNYAISPDGRTAVATVSNGIALFNLETGELIRRYRRPGHFPQRIALSPDGQTAVSGSPDLLVIQWQVGALSLDEILAWTGENRIAREPTCEESRIFAFGESCETEPVSGNSPSTAEDPFEVPERMQTAVVGVNGGSLAQGEFAVWLYEGSAGELLDLHLNALEIPDNLEAERMDVVLIIIAPDGSRLAINDDDESGSLTTDSAILDLVLPSDGVYRIEVHFWQDGQGGPYELVIESR